MAEDGRVEAARALALSLAVVSRDPNDLLALATRLVADADVPTSALRAMARALDGRGAPVEAPAEPPHVASPVKRRDQSGRAPTHPDQSGALLEWALREAADAGSPLARVGTRGQTYRSRRGQPVHVRTMHRHDRGQGRYSYWFGLAEVLWTPGGVFMLVCDRDAILVIPSDELIPYRELVAMAKGTHRQPNIWRVDGRFELRASGQHIDVSAWVNRFDLA